jgi:ParB family chromosome partitioning protein
MRIVHIETVDIFVPEAHRPVDQDKVAQIADSIAKVGLLQPITVTYEGGRIRLVAGAHRLAAAKRLGWKEIPAVVALGDAVQLWLIEIAENLHRAELTALEQADLTVEWINLQSSELRTNESRREDGRGHRPESGVNAAARELGIAKSTAHERVKIAALSTETKAVATEVGLNNNRSALLAAAKEAAPEKQAEVIRARAGKPSANSKPDTLPKTQSGIRDALMQARSDLKTAQSRIADLEDDNRRLRDRIAVLEAADRAEARRAAP